MEYFLVILFIVFLILAVLIQVLSLPGNWLAIILVIIWKFIGPASSVANLSWGFILLLIVLAAIGEIMEWLLQLKVGKQFGSSFKGNIGGIIGAIVGAILFLPLFFGFGALLGALVGAYLGCLAAELLQGRDRQASGASQGNGRDQVVRLARHGAARPEQDQTKQRVKSAPDEGADGRALCATLS